MDSQLFVLLRRLTMACALPQHGFIPFYTQGHLVGQVSSALAREIARWPEIFSVTPQRIDLSAHLISSEARTEAMAQVADALRQDGWLAGWRNETAFIAPGFGEAPLFHIERAAMRTFGLTMHAAHVNGISGDGSGKLWLARRSADKAIDPGRYDTLVGGGLGDGRGIFDTIVKESWEEAGISAAHAGQARPAGTIRVRRAVAEGWHDEVIFIHDLRLPADFQPANQDGEVQAFACLPLPDILHLMSDTDQVTIEATFIICDFMLRTGFIHPETPGYLPLRALIHRSRYA